MPGRTPSITTPRAGPWLSPKVVMRKLSPMLLETSLLSLPDHRCAQQIALSDLLRIEVCRRVDDQLATSR